MTRDASRKVLILSLTQTGREPRVLKQIQHFRTSWNVTTAGFGPAPDGVDEHIEFPRVPARQGLARIPGVFTLLLLLRWHRLYARIEPRNTEALRHLAGGSWDVVIAHDAQTLYIAAQIAPARTILADMHEYAPRQSAPSLGWRLLHQPYYTWLCRTYLVPAGRVTTVSPGIVEEYRRVFDVEARLVINATPYRDLQPSRVGAPIRLVHSGGAAPDRKLETLVTAVVNSQADVTLDFYLVDDDSGYVATLKELAHSDPRVRFNEAVPYDRLVETLAGYDVGVHVIAPTSFNNYWSLPNKFFDYVQARLGVIIGPSPAMVEFVDEHGFGMVAKGFSSEDLSDVLERITPEQVSGWKAAAHAIAKELSGEEQARIWGALAEEMMSR